MISKWLRPSSGILTSGILASLALSQVAQAQKSPLDLLDVPQSGERSVQVHPSRSSLSDVPSDFPQTGQLEDPDRIATNAGRILANIRNAATQYSDAKQKVIKDKEKSSRLQAEADRLRVEKKQALQELRDGRYCSKCKRTASEIEREEKLSFQQHLNKVDGREIAASEEMINAKANEYDGKIKNLDAQIRGLEMEMNGLNFRMQQAANTVLSGTAFWEDAIAKEDDLCARQWQQKFEEARKQLQALKTALDVNNGQIRKLITKEHPHSGPITVRDPALIELNDSAGELRRSIRELFDRFQSESFRNDQARAALDQRATEGLRALQGYASEVDSFMTPCVPSAPEIAATFNKGRKGSEFKGSFEMRSGRPGISGIQITAKLGHFKAVLDMSNDWLRHALSVGVYAGMDTPSGYAGVGMKKTTTFQNGKVTTRDELSTRRPALPKSGNDLLDDKP